MPIKVVEIGQRLLHAAYQSCLAHLVLKVMRINFEGRIFFNFRNSHVLKIHEQIKLLFDLSNLLQLGDRTTWKQANRKFRRVFNSRLHHVIFTVSLQFDNRYFYVG